MEISILDVKTLKKVYSYRMKQKKGDQGLSERELFILAWRCALSDGAVTENEQDQYLLSIEAK